MSLWLRSLTEVQDPRACLPRDDVPAGWRPARL